MAWRLAVPAVGLAVAGQLALAGPASATHLVSTAATVHHALKRIPVNWNRPSLIDCNGWGEHNGQDVPSARDAMKSLCTDPYKRINGHGHRFIDNGWYVGHDEPSVKFISGATGSGNTMSYGMQLPVDPAKAPTATGSVTKYGELSVAPWFGLPMCDPNSYPQNACTPLSDAPTNTGMGAPTDAGSAFMELQFYPPGFTPFIDSTSCSVKQWCAALTIDSLSCTFNFGTCNNACIEPVNFSFLQTDGVPPGPPAPQDPTSATFLGNANTLKMNPGDVLKVSITDVPATQAPNDGLKASVTDVTTNQTGYIVASAANGFASTLGIQNGQAGDCSGVPYSFHAEYDTAAQVNQVPWAALEGGVLMEQEIGHGEACTSVSNKMGFSTSFYADPSVYQTCIGGTEGSGKRGEGPCNLNTFICQHATTQGAKGPVACPTKNAASGALCEFADGFCFKKGSRNVQIDGQPAKESWPLAGCTQNFAQNGDLDFDGIDYRADWPNGSANFPTSIRYVGPFTGGNTYPQVQFETNVGGSSARCVISGPNIGKHCVAPPQGAKFYPFWTMTNKQGLGSLTPNAGSCVWNFGNVITGVTTSNFGKAKEYGTPDLLRFAGTLTSAPMTNPEFAGNCATIPPF